APTAMVPPLPSAPPVALDVPAMPSTVPPLPVGAPPLSIAAVPPAASASAVVVVHPLAVATMASRMSGVVVRTGTSPSPLEQHFQSRSRKRSVNTWDCSPASGSLEPGAICKLAQPRSKPVAMRPARSGRRSKVRIQVVERSSLYSAEVLDGPRERAVRPRLVRIRMRLDDEHHDSPSLIMPLQVAIEPRHRGSQRLDEAAVDDVVRTRDVGGPGRGEQRHQRSDLLRRGKASCRETADAGEDPFPSGVGVGTRGLRDGSSDAALTEPEVRRDRAGRNV